MRYKVGDEVMLRDDLVVYKPYKGAVYTEVLNTLADEPIRINWLNKKNKTYYVTGGNVISCDMIDHDKTAELHKKNKTLKHYSSELKKIVAEKNNREHVDAIEPAHYRQGNIDRIEVWYQTYPFEGFRWAMKSHIDKYIHRYESKGGVEDLDKATYFIKRLKEKEMEE